MMIMMIMMMIGVINGSLTQLLREPGRVALLEINISKNNLFIKIRINTTA